MGYLGPLARIKNVFVDFVREAKRVKFLAQSGDKLHFGAGKDFARRIVRVADNDGLRPGIESRAQILPIETPIGARKKHVAAARPKESRPGIVFIERFEDDYFLARIDRRHHRGNHAFGRTARDRDFSFRIDIEPEIPFRLRAMASRKSFAPR